MPTARSLWLCALVLLGVCAAGVRAADEDKWLGDLNLNPKTKLGHLMFPGSHDAGCYKMTAFFDGSLAKFETQDLTIGQQLSAGYRFFDIRFRYYPSEGLKIIHAPFSGEGFFRDKFSGNGASWESIRLELLAFLADPNHAKEIVFFRVKLSEVDAHNQAFFMNDFADTFKHYMVGPPISSGSFVKSLAEMTLEEIWQTDRGNVALLAYDWPSGDVPSKVELDAARSLNKAYRDLYQSLKEAFVTPVEPGRLQSRDFHVNILSEMRQQGAPYVWSYTAEITGRYSNSDKTKDVIKGQYDNAIDIKAVTEAGSAKKSRDLSKLFGFWFTFTGGEVKSVLQHKLEKYPGLIKRQLCDFVTEMPGGVPMANFLVVDYSGTNLWAGLEAVVAGPVYLSIEFNKQFQVAPPAGAPDYKTVLCDMSELPRMAAERPSTAKPRLNRANTIVNLAPEPDRQGAERPPLTRVPVAWVNGPSVPLARSISIMEEDLSRL